ncbi:hypothetical protein QOU27_29885 [Pseudomonas aeruginosa]|nr:hypothetical protein [Pseudomonas aeruginosa]
MSKELNKAPVEQAGGDERAAFRPAQVISYRHGMGEVTIYVAGRVPGYMNIGDTVYVSDRAPVEQPIAALAQPSPTLPPFAEKVLTKLRRFNECAEDPGSGGVDIGRHWLDLLTQLGLLNRVQRSPALWEISQQGEDLLGTPQPSPAQAEQAEAERPEVVARVVHSNPVVLDHCGPLNANDELMTVAQHAASVARWAEMFNRVEQERDSALAEVERLRESKGDPSGSFDRCMKMMYERDENAKQLEVALARVAELTATRNRYGVDAHYFNKNLQRILRDFESFTPDELARSLIILAKVADEKVVAQAQQLHDLDKQCRDDVARALGLRPSQERGFAWSYLLASIKSCAKASEDAAQAQHSVPEGWKLVPVEQLLNMMSDKDHDTRIMAERQLLAVLAAAPRTEVPQAWLDVQAERRRQVTAEGWTPEHDDEHACDEIAAFACFYAMPPAARDWDASSTGYGDTLGEAILPEGWEPKTGDRRRELVKAGGLILAEIERLDRAPAPGKEVGHE